MFFLHIEAVKEYDLYEEDVNASNLYEQDGNASNFLHFYVNLHKIHSACARKNISLACSEYFEALPLEDNKEDEDDYTNYCLIAPKDEIVSAEPIVKDIVPKDNKTQDRSKSYGDTAYHVTNEEEMRNKVHSLEKTVNELKLDLELNKYKSEGLTHQVEMLKSQLELMGIKLKNTKQ
jgi:hypothetical protein